MSFSADDSQHQLDKQDLAKERLLRWKIQQSLKTKQDKPQITSTPLPLSQTTSLHHLQPTQSTDEDPLDAYMRSIQTLQTASTATPSLQPLEEQQEEIPSLAPSQDVIAASAQKKPKLITDQISLQKLAFIQQPDTTPFRKVFYKDSSNPAPIERWEQAGLSTKVLSTLQSLRFEKPTRIQAQTIPAILSGLDVIGIAKTGSGKTLAFVLPLIRHVIDQRPLAFGEGPIALILTPTRELALQIYEQLGIFLRGTTLKAIACYGGPPIKDQIGALKRGAEIVVSTPGRMIDLLCANSGRVTNLRRTTFLVVDEADRMFDVGFEPQVLKIASVTRPDRQTVLFSATFPRAIETLAKKILDVSNYIHIHASTAREGTIACSDIDQRIECLEEEEDKFPLLLRIIGEFHLTHGSAQKILIFVQRQESADCLLRDLLRKGYHCCSLHGGKDQSDRDCAISDFKSGMIPIMVATSVAARGLDVPDLDIVVNYDCPSHLEDYVHRVGRTGRAGRKGVAYTFITPDQARQAAQIEKALVMGGVKEIPPALHALAKEAQDVTKRISTASGYGGKGLERLDNEREHNKLVQSHAFSIAEGEANDIEESIPELQSIGGNSKSISHSNKSEVLSSLGRAVYQAVEKIHNRLKALGIKIESEPYDPLLKLNTKLGYSSVEGSGQIIPIPEGAAAATDHSGQRMKFCCEFLINDYSQQARWRVTNRDNLSALTLASGTAITVRGTYVPPARKQMAETERKLFLYIEGPNSETVESVREQIKQILNESN
jgi:ATP-dependent RNA helicase DDX46/PRP5